MDQPRIQTAFLPGQMDPDDLTLEQPKSSETKPQGELYAPVSTKFVNRKQSNNKPSAELDGPPEGAEMNDLYSPQSAVDIETSDKPKEESTSLSHFLPQPTSGYLLCRQPRVCRRKLW